MRDEEGPHEEERGANGEAEDVERDDALHGEEHEEPDDEDGLPGAGGAREPHQGVGARTGGRRPRFGDAGLRSEDATHVGGGASRTSATLATPPSWTAQGRRRRGFRRLRLPGAGGDEARRGRHGRFPAPSRRARGDRPRLVPGLPRLRAGRRGDAHRALRGGRRAGRLHVPGGARAAARPGSRPRSSRSRALPGFRGSARRATGPDTGASFSPTCRATSPGSTSTPTTS